MKRVKMILKMLSGVIMFCCMSVYAAEEKMNLLYIHVNDEVLICECADNSSSESLLEKLKYGDISLDMSDYGSFEKVGDLGFSLPQNNEQIHTEPGDVILYLGKTFSIYYGQNSWSLTRLGKIKNKSETELKSILGNSDVKIRLSLKE